MRAVPDTSAHVRGDGAGGADRETRFGALVDEVYEPVQRYVRRRTHPADVDDVVADTLLVLWRRLDDVPADAALPWSYGVARRCLANSRRSVVRQERLVERLQDGLGPSYSAPEDDLLHTALAALGDDDRALLQLWSWERLEPREIAQVLGISANAASIRLHRAKKRLRAAMVGGKDSAVAGHIQDRQKKERR